MTMTTRFETEIHVDQEVPLVRLTRRFAAEPARVFQAHTDADLFGRWNGPGENAMEVDWFDCRSGGSYRYTITTGDGFVAGFRGSFHEVRPDDLIVQTFTFEGMPDGVALEKITFEPVGDGHTLLVATSLVDSFVDRDAFVATGMEEGVRQGYEKLDRLLA